jgi:hypothetical protein
MDISHRFLSEGHERATNASEPIVDAAVERQFADQLDSASVAEQEPLRKEIENAIAQRLNTIAPPDALY